MSSLPSPLFIKPIQLRPDQPSCQYKAWTVTNTDINRVGVLTRMYPRARMGRDFVSCPVIPDYWCFNPRRMRTATNTDANRVGVLTRMLAPDYAKALQGYERVTVGEKSVSHKTSLVFE